MTLFLITSFYLLFTCPGVCIGIMQVKFDPLIWFVNYVEINKMPSNDLKRTILQKFREFCKHCTLHGFYYFSEKRRLWVYAIWTIVIASGLALSTFLCQMIWQKFIVDPTFTVVETSHYSTTKIPFPAVTLCDSDVVYGPSTTNISYILKSRGYELNQIEAFFKSFTDIREKDYTPDQDVKKIHLLLHDLGYTLNLLMELLRKPCDVLLVKCVWRSKLHNCTEMFREVYTHVGYCCQFDMAYFRQHAESDVTFVAGVESTEALDVIVNGNKVTANGSISDGYISLFVYDDKNSITVVENAIHLTPAGFFDVNVYVWIIDSSKDARILPVNDRKCLLPGDKFIGPGFYQGCISMHIMKRVVSFCRCLPFNYTSNELDVDDYSACTWERMTCIFQTIAQVHGDVRDLLSENECLQKCDYVQYDTEIDYIRRKRSYRTANESFSHVNVHFSSNTCFKYRRQVLYTWDQLLANLGGIFGLCLGGSIISLVEIVWFIFDLLQTVFMTLTKNKVTQNKKNKTNIFILNQKNLTKDSIGKKINDENDMRYRFVN